MCKVTYGERAVALSDLGRKVSAQDIAKVAIALSRRQGVAPAQATVKINGNTYVVKSIKPGVPDSV